MDNTTIPGAALYYQRSTAITTITYPIHTAERGATDTCNWRNCVVAWEQTLKERRQPAATKMPALRRRRDFLAMIACKSGAAPPHSQKHSRAKSAGESADFRFAKLWECACVLVSLSSAAPTSILTIHESPFTIHSRKLSQFSLSKRGCSSMVERQLPKLHTRVRFPSPACLSDLNWGTSLPNFRRKM